MNPQVERAYGEGCIVKDPRSGITFDLNPLRRQVDYEVCELLTLLLWLCHRQASSGRDSA